MEERIQRKVTELKMKPKKLFQSSPTYEELREEAVRIVEKDIQHEEDLKNRIQKQQEESKKTQERMQREFEKKQQEKKEEEEREQLKLIQNKEDPDMPLTLKDIREIKGFDYDAYRRALDELNVEILKRIIRETYPHKFKLHENQ